MTVSALTDSDMRLTSPSALASVAGMTNDLPSFETDRWGFPIEQCQRCAGHGRIPAYGDIFGGVCFGCNGAGKAYPNRAIKALVNEHTAWLRKRADVSLCSRIDLQTAERVTYASPGDVIRPWGQRVGQHALWRTVADVRVLPDIIGMSLTGAAADEVRALIQRVLVTFDDGSSVRGFGETWVRRIDQATADAHVMPLVARAAGIHVRALRRRGVSS